MKKLITFIGYLIIALLILFLYLDHQANKPFSQSKEIKIFVIEKGEGLKKIGEKLENEGLIKDKNIFILYSFLKNLRKNFLPGEYELQKNMSLKRIIEILTSPRKEKKITLIEGLNVNEIASYLEKEKIVKKDDFLEKIKDVDFFKERYEFLKDEKIKSLEGFLFPDTYYFFENSKSEEVILKMLDNFDKKISQLKNEIDKQKKTIYEIVILASIIEKEVRFKEDKYLVADIFYRRLKANIPLQADSTINYFTGKKLRQATAEDIKIDNPYNTYKYKGLPPGPISNPGLDSILAAIYPQKNEWWYFLNREDGTTIYSKTLKEHNLNKAKYLKKEISFKDVYIANETFVGSLIPNDPYFETEQWYLERIEAKKAWDITTGSEDIVVALLDSGIDIDHPDLKENIWVNLKEIPNDKIDNDNNGYIDDINGWNFVENNPDPRPKTNNYTLGGIHHGTVVAGLIAAIGNNNQGIIGLAPKVKIMPIKVLNDKGEGDLESVIQGIYYAIKNKANIINLSFVGPVKSELLYQAIKEAWQANILIVAAAGNNSKNEGDDLDLSPLYPICLEKETDENMILGVTATDQADKKAIFANYGKKCIDLSAPGTRIFSTLFYSPIKSEFKDYYGGYWSGTSLAAPLVSATSALIKSLNPLLSNREIRNIILETVDQIDYLNEKFAGKLGKGRLNTYKAVLKVYQNLTAIPQYRYLVVAPGFGSPPLIRILKPNGLKVTEFYAYHPNFRGGVSVSSCDLDGDGLQEIITGPREGGGPQIRTFDADGRVKGQFFAYSEEFRGGINISCGDLNGDKKDEIIVAPSKGDLPLRVFNQWGEVISQFYPYYPEFKGGISLAVGDLDGDQIKEIITGVGSNGRPQVKIFDLKGRIKGQFLAYNEKFKGGINVSAGDLNGDGLDEIVVGIASDASPYVRVFNNTFNLKSQFLAYERNFRKGVFLTIEDLDGDKNGEIITVPSKGGGPQVRIFNSYGEPKTQFFAYEKIFNKGLTITTIKKFE